MTLPQYENLLELERHLGDPFEARNLFSFRAAVEWDEADAYPESACDLLNRWGMSSYYVPASLGGKFINCEQVLNLMRGVARRDLTVAIGHGKTFLGAIAVWMAGSTEQQSRLARIILEDGQTALALTEQKHGADLLASEVELRREGEGFRLYGAKWLINNATRGRALTVFARSDVKGGARGFSLVLFEKAAHDKASFRPLPKIRTHGIRGADISGIQFDNCPVPPYAIVGTVGSGLEIVLKSLQVTRTLCAALSLGAVDTALRIALDFARERRLYDNTVFNIPYPRELLLDCFLDLLICDCVSIGGARALHVAPEQMSVWSAIVKTFVPLTVESIIIRLSVVLGARYYLREGYCDGIFQKILRDAAIVSLFDGSSAVNFEIVAMQMRQRLRQNRSEASLNAAGESLSLIFNLDTELPPLRFEAFDLWCKGADPVFATLPYLDEELAACCVEMDVRVSETLKHLLSELRDSVARLRSEVEAESRARAAGQRPSTKQFRLARRYTTLHAAASCLHFWMGSRRHLAPVFREGIGLILCLSRLLDIDALPADESTISRWQETMLDELLRLHSSDQLFSMTPLALASRSIDHR
jgi:alkylation response protein AidB-like acyl-CoA dehydrogenase